MLVFSYFLKPYTHISYKIEAFNEFFQAKSEDKNIVNKDNKAIVSFRQKVMLILNICPNKKLKRFMLKGDRRLYKELDTCRIIKEIKDL